MDSRLIVDVEMAIRLSRRTKAEMAALVAGFAVSLVRRWTGSITVGLLRFFLEEVYLLPAVDFVLASGFPQTAGRGPPGWREHPGARWFV